MKAEYTKKIESLLQKCEDIALLDLIYRLLKKATEREVTTE